MQDFSIMLPSSSTVTVLGELAKPRFKCKNILILLIASSFAQILGSAEATCCFDVYAHCTRTSCGNTCGDRSEPYECDLEESPASFSYSSKLHKVMIPNRISKPPIYNPSIPWDRNYINVWTPEGGLLVSDDRFQVELRITSPNQTFGQFQSKNKFIFGYFSMYLKLVPKESAGVISTFYIASPEVTPKESDRHDEIDFEFLGNTSGNPITLQTNVFVNGTGNREQWHYLSFDPTAAFHKYSVLWNQHLIIWFVDDNVIRVFRNKSKEISVPYPVSRPMAVYCSIWTTQAGWATENGRVQLNYSYAPFVTQYKGFDGVDGCPVCDATPPATTCDNADISTCNDSTKYWYLEQEELTERQIIQLEKQCRQYIVSDYCTDTERFSEECPLNSYSV